MSDIKFSCPSCQQHIQAESSYAGLEINCPACNARMAVPGKPAPALAYAVAPSATPPAYSVPAPPPLDAPPVQASGSCPSCGSALGRGAVLCTNCGYNLVTKQRMVAGRTVGMGGSMGAMREASWYQSPLLQAGI